MKILTKKQMAQEMIGTCHIANMDAFWKRALAKNKEWMTRAYVLYQKDKAEGKENVEHFYFALLNK